jgi:hypothetical protein
MPDLEPHRAAIPAENYSDLVKRQSSGPHRLYAVAFGLGDPTTGHLRHYHSMSLDTPPVSK